MAELVLITREGCCLCEGLEEKLAAEDVDECKKLVPQFREAKPGHWVACSQV